MKMDQPAYFIYFFLISEFAGINQKHVHILS